MKNICRYSFWQSSSYSWYLTLTDSYVMQFEGDDMVAYSFPQGRMRTLQDHYALNFKTLEKDGILLHSEGLQGDSITLELKTGQLYLHISLGNDDKSIHPSIRPSVHPSILLSVCLCLSVHPSVLLSVYLCLSVCLSIFVCLSVCLSIRLSIHLSFYHSIVLSIILSTITGHVFLLFFRE